LVVLGCNTATCVAARTLQKDWLPVSGWAGCNVLGIVAPTVEAATQTPWAVTAPQYPQKYNTDAIAVFGTTRTIASHAYPEEIRKRCPKVTVVQQTCSELAGAIERGAPEIELDRLVEQGVAALLARTAGAPPHRAILGCTHYPLVEHLFRTHLPAFTRLLSQPEVVADSLEDYLQRHPRYVEDEAEGPAGGRSAPLLLTTGEPARQRHRPHLLVGLLRSGICRCRARPAAPDKVSRPCASASLPLCVQRAPGPHPARGPALGECRQRVRLWPPRASRSMGASMFSASATNARRFARPRHRAATRRAFAIAFVGVTRAEAAGRI
jgi:glutamate racemase